MSSRILLSIALSAFLLIFVITTSTQTVDGHGGAGGPGHEGRKTITITQYAFAEEPNILKWVLTIYEFWDEKKITDLEFTNAIEYLQDSDIIHLLMPKGYDATTNFLITILHSERIDSKSSLTNCSTNWYVTGYYTPVELDYSGDLKMVVADDNVRRFKSDFLVDVKQEGWGRTLSGDYLGWYDNSYHLSDAALDLKGNQLVVESTAVDLFVLEHGTSFMITTLPHPWNEVIFKASDIGPSIKGKHIDVFTGEGEQAKLETKRITGYSNELCIGE